MGQSFAASTHFVDSPVKAGTALLAVRGASGVPVWGGSTVAINGGGFGTSCVCSLPGSAAVGDLLIAWGGHSGDSTLCNISEAGWTVLGRLSPGNMNGVVAYRIKDGTEGASITFTGANAYWAVGVAYVSGVDNANPFWDSVFLDYTSAVGNPIATGELDGFDDCLGVGVWTCDRDVGGSNPSQDWQASSPASLQIRQSVATVASEVMSAIGTGDLPIIVEADFDGVSIG